MNVHCGCCITITRSLLKHVALQRTDFSALQRSSFSAVALQRTSPSALQRFSATARTFQRFSAQHNSCASARKCRRFFYSLMHLRTDAVLPDLAQITLHTISAAEMKTRSLTERRHFEQREPSAISVQRSICTNTSDSPAGSSRATKYLTWPANLLLAASAG